MDNSQPSFAEASADKQPKPDPKGKAITSFVLGIVSVAMGALSIIIGLFQPKILWPILFPYGWDTSAAIMVALAIGIPGIILSTITSLSGLILGIISLKSSKKNFAVTGIVLCGVVLLFVIGLLIFLGTSQMRTQAPLPPSGY